MSHQLLPPPLGYRKNIPLYYPKTEAEIKADNYEIYNPNVLRSCRNFYEGQYGTTLLNKIKQNLDNSKGMSIAELGCGSGYLIGKLALELPESHCLGFDYSYQMLKIGAQVFKNDRESEVELKAFQNGMSDLRIATENLSNLRYALSDACVTPLSDNSIDFCFSCFLWDRVGDQSKLLEEKIRITKPGGSIVIISPFNYLSQSGWNDWHPIDKVIDAAKEGGLEMIRQERFQLEETLDIRGNRVVWEVDYLFFDFF